MTRRHVSRRDRPQLWFLLARGELLIGREAPVQWAARVEAAAGGRVRGTGNLAFENHGPTRAGLHRIGHGDRRVERQRIRMHRPGVDRLGRRELDELAQVHHRAPVHSEPFCVGRVGQLCGIDPKAYLRSAVTAALDGRSSRRSSPGRERSSMTSVGSSGNGNSSVKGTTVAFPWMPAPTRTQGTMPEQIHRQDPIRAQLERDLDRRVRALGHVEVAQHHLAELVVLVGMRTRLPGGVAGVLTGTAVSPLCRFWSGAFWCHPRCWTGDCAGSSALRARQGSVVTNFPPPDAESSCPSTATNPPFRCGVLPTFSPQRPGEVLMSFRAPASWAGVPPSERALSRGDLLPARPWRADRHGP